ncbi:MAG: class I SAM-dependent methyltransferase [Bacteriovoracaceae bacterium]|nr:class I SAM-dependent methyltransferase [Bacteriovoracaceae bacterium]
MNNIKDKNKSYYHAHESAYKSIKQNGQVGWGNVKTIEELGDDQTKEYLRLSVKNWISLPAGKKALDLGCGTGTTAFVLSKLGFEVWGIDISETAIEMANDLAIKQNLKINFSNADILELGLLNEKFHLIYDSHCLHCIVFEDDRMKVLNGIYESMLPSGRFILDTMVIEEDFNSSFGFPTLRFDENYILWHKTNNSDLRGVVKLQEQEWCPQRRIYPSMKIIEEVHSAGFTILDKKLDKQEEGEPWMLRLVLGK